MKNVVRAGLLLIAMTACSEDPGLISNGPVTIDGDTIIVEGKIDADLAKSVVIALSQNDNLTTMVISSPGGDARAGLAIGSVVSQAGLDVTVRGICASACAQYVFVAGGNKRVEEGGIIALHSSPSAMKAVLERSPYKAESGVFSDVAEAEVSFYRNLGVNMHFPLVAASQMTPICALRIGNEIGGAAEQYGVGWAASAFIPSPAQLRSLGVEDIEGNWPSSHGLHHDLSRLGFSPKFKPVHNEAAKLSISLPEVGICELSNNAEKQL